MVSQFLKASGIDYPAPWCAGFMNHVTGEVTSGLYDSTPLAKVIMNQYIETGSFHSYGDGYTPRPGDAIFFDRGTESWQGHAGFVKSVNRDGTITIIEGNKPPEEFEGAPNEDAIPDIVREITYTPAQLQAERIIGFGNTFELFEANGATLTPSRTRADLDAQAPSDTLTAQNNILDLNTPT